MLSKVLNAVENVPNQGKSIILSWLQFYHSFPTQKIMKIPAMRSVFTTKIPLNYFCGWAGASPHSLQGEFIQIVVDCRQGKHPSQSPVLTPSASQCLWHLNSQRLNTLSWYSLLKVSAYACDVLVFKISSEENNYTFQHCSN